MSAPLLWYGGLAVAVVVAFALILWFEDDDPPEDPPLPPPRLIALTSRGHVHVMEFQNDADLANTVRMLARRQEENLIEN